MNTPLKNIQKDFSFGKIMTRSIMIMLLLTLVVNAMGQVAGDYRSRGNGNWNANGTWQVYNGTAWANCGAGDYPGATSGAGNVEIINNNTVTITANVTNSIGSLTINGGNQDSYLQFNAGVSLTVTGQTLLNSNSNNDEKSVLVDAGNFQTGSITATGGGANQDAYVRISTGTVTVSGDITLNSANDRTYIRFTDSGTLYVGGNMTGGGITSAAGGGASAPTSGTVNYNGASAQNVGAYTYFNLTVSGGSNKVLTNNTQVNNTLTLTSGVLQLSGFNITLPTAATSNVAGGPFSSTCMIETNGTGYVQQTVPTVVPYTMPIGSNGAYSPVTVQSIATSTYLRFNTTYSAILGSQYLKRYWQLTANAASASATITFKYDPVENTSDPTLIWQRPTSGSWTTPVGTQSFNSGAKTFTITNTSNISATTSEWTAGYPLKTFFSYQTGNWNQASTWTSDPGGTTYVNIGTPGNDDIVVILPNRTVTLTANVTATNLEVNINSGGILNLSTFSITNTLTQLNGQGTLKLASVSFPSATINTFVNTNGGTTEYNNAANFTLPAAQATYNNLRINAPAVTATQLSNISLNGNLQVMQGTYRINDATAARRQLTVLGNVTVDAGAFMSVGNGVTNSTTDPLLVAEGGTTMPFINYYDTQSHRVVIYGDFTNNGSVRLTNLTYPVFDAFPPTTAGATSGFATVYFMGASNNTLYCNGATDFYNLVLDKGVDQTYSLTVYSTAYQNFRIYGANIRGGYGGTANPNLQKALWIRTGTFVLQGLSIIPSLSEGTGNTGTGGPNSDYFVPGNGALVLDGDNVVVLTTADDYREVNVAYGVSGGTGLVNGVGLGGSSSFSIYGLLKVNKGYLSTRESGGLIQWAVASGQLEINGGVVDAKQYRTAGSSGGLASYTQTGGIFHLRGRFRRTPAAYTFVNDLVNAPIGTNRLNSGLNGAVGTYNLNETANVYNMSGGTINIYDVCGDGTAAAEQKAFEVYASASNVSVTGGTVAIFPTDGTVLANSPNYRILTTTQFNNFTVDRQSGTSVVLMDTYPLVVFQNLTLLNGELNANSLNVNIGGNFVVSAGTTYTPGNNWTIFDGPDNQTITANIVTPLAFKKFKMIKGATKILLFSGTQTDFQVSDSLDLISGTLNDGGKTISLVPSATTTQSRIYMGARHLGTGKFVIAEDDPTAIEGDGNGIFRNLELNNTDVLVAPVSLSANLTISGTLTLSNDKLFNIGTSNLKFNSTGSIVGYSATRYVQTSGQAGSGGITKTYSATTPSFIFPIGTASTRHALPVYTPSTITINGSPTLWGDITVNPVGYEHPATKVKNRSLTYYWRVKSSGFTLGSATVTHRYDYDQADVVTGGDVDEAGYVAARFDIGVSNWSRGNVDDVDETNNYFGEPAAAGAFLENTANIDGDYTVGDDDAVNPFDTPAIFYSRTSGTWNSPATWSNTGHTGLAAATSPGTNDIVTIGDTHTVSLTQTENAAIVRIALGGVLDISNFTTSNFGMVLSHPSGNGLFRLKTNDATAANRIQLYTFPSGDFSDFNTNKGTTEFYTTTSNGANVYVLPSNVSNYGNLILSPNGLDNLSLPNNASTKIYGDLTINSSQANSWTTMSWNTTNWGSGIFNPTIEKTVYVYGNFYVNGGSFVFMNDYQPQHLVVEKDFVISNVSGANVFVLDPTFYGTWVGGTPQANTIQIGGSLINNSSNYGTWYPGLRLLRGNYYCDVTFTSSGNSYLTNTLGSPTTILRNVIVNKGDSQIDSLIVNIGGTLTTLTDNWLTLSNGTLVYRRVNPSSDFTISTSTPFSIPETAGLYIDYPSNSGNRNVLISNAANNAADITLGGKLTMVAGNVYVGPTNGTTNNNNDIVYSGDGLSTLNITGGQLVVNGQIRRNTSTTTGVLKYYQTGGSVVINGMGGDATALTRAKLEVVNNGSVFSMSGGNITVVRGGGTTFGDLYIRPETGSVTGGEIIFSQVPIIGPTVDAVQSYKMDANTTLNNLTVNGKTTGTARSATVTLMINPLVLNGTLNLNNIQSFFDANSSTNLNVTIKGDFVNNGTYYPRLNTTTFSGGAQSILGASASSFYTMVVNPVTSLTLSGSIVVNDNLSILSGQLICGNNTVTLYKNLLNNGNYTDNGSGIILKGTVQQQISGTGTFGTLELDNSLGSRLLNSISLNKNLVLTKGVFNINQYLLTLGVNSNISGTSFSATKMIESDGVFSNVGVRKYFPIYNGADVTFTYPIGSGGKYTPAEFTYSRNDVVGYIRINNINSYHPGVLDLTRVLKYFWEAQGNAISNVTGNLKFYYNQADVVGSEPDYVAARTVNSTSWSKALTGSATDRVDETNNIITFPFSTASDFNGEFTAGEESAIPNNIPQFTSNTTGNWNVPGNWTQTGGDSYTLSGGPDGFIVTIRPSDVITINQNYAFTYKTTINGTLNAPLPYFGHNLGIVSGNGKLVLQNGTIPAGRYTDFFDCSIGGTLEYSGSTDYNIIADLYTSVPKLHFTGTGNRVLPSKDLTICNQLLINGPTLDNSVNNRMLTIQGTMERYATGLFKAGAGANAKVVFAGSTAQTIGGALGDFTGTSKFNHFEISNSNGLTVNSTGQFEVGGNLYLTSGNIITTTTDKLTITNTAISCVFPAGGSSVSYVDGPLTKTILQGDNFKYPVGKGSVLGNKINLSSTQTGTINWTVEFFTPNPTYATYAAPLTYVNSKEYWVVSATAGSQAYVGLDWDPASDLTPLMTQNGLSDMRVAYDNGGVWTMLTSASSGTSSSGTVSTTSRITIPAGGSQNYTTSCINTTKPRARFNPTGSVCGTAGIPMIFIGTTIPFNYIIGYTKNGVAQTPVTITALPYSLPTDATGATYVLTSFTYNNPGSPTTGVVDATPVLTYTVPTTASAGLDQSICGATSATLAANTPTVGTGLWSITIGAGGTVVSPTVTTSTFNGTNGTNYTLRWTITNGGCTSTDDVNISFPLLPEQPTAFILSDNSVCQGETGVDYSVANNPSLTYTWGYSGTGGSIIGSGFAIEIDYGVLATSGTVSVYTTNGCGDSAPLNLAVTVNGRPTASIAINPSFDNICDGDNTALTITLAGGTSPYSFQITNGTATENITGATSPYAFTPIAANKPVWLGPNPSKSYTYSIPTVTSANGCSNTGSNTVNVLVWKIPETGPEYHVPNSYNY